MTNRAQAANRLWRCQAGAAAIEFAIVASVMIVVCIGIIDIGRGLYLRNELSYAADRAARVVLMSGETQADRAAAVERARAAARSAFRGAQEPLEVNIPEPGTSDQSVTITMSYPFRLLIPGLSNGAIRLTVNRRVPLV